MKIGFLMGSFDPIHIGHINMVRESLNFLDKVILVPSGHNPWKKNCPAPFNLRMEMIASAIKPFGDLADVSDVEKTFDPPYYSHKPLRYFKELYKNDERYIICGSDTTEKIPLWKNAVEDILPYYKILSLDRYEKQTKDPKENCEIKYLIGPDGKKYEYEHVFINPLPISSTYIRQLIKDKKQTFPLLPIEVYDIIAKNGLYNK